MLQLDLQKAYAMVDLCALEHVLQEIGMPSEFVNWIMTTVTNVSYEFNINGHTSDILMAKRGLRQDDPISPLLFVLMMEYFDRFMKKMQTNLDFNYHSKCEKIGTPNLTFADDILLFYRCDPIFVHMMMTTVDIFSTSTGLVINPKKCNIYCGGMDRDDKMQLSQASGFDEGKLPMKYLGIPITSKKLTVSHYKPLIEKITQRLKHWTVKLLSYAGRIMLVKSVILVIAQYWMQCLPLPQAVIAHIDRLCKTFVWTGNTDRSRKSPVAWSNVCRPKSHDGQGIINLNKWNKITMLKCLWNLCSKYDNIWVK